MNTKQYTFFFQTNPIDSFLVIIKRDEILHFGYCKNFFYRIYFTLSKNNYFLVLNKS